jgi:peroxiredoxin Q/BCP
MAGIWLNPACFHNVIAGISIAGLHTDEVRNIEIAVYAEPSSREIRDMKIKYPKHLVFALVCMLWVAEPFPEKAMEKVKEGSKVPVFALQNQDGKEFDLKSVLGKKNLVIYFYPKDDTPGCTKEACHFRDQFEAFNQADALIIGISAQSVESHKAFAEKYKLTFTLLSDPDNTVRKMFGVPAGLFGTVPGRVTYVVDKTGVVVYVFNSQTEPTRHVDEALRILKGMK